MALWRVLDAPKQKATTDKPQRRASKGVADRLGCLWRYSLKRTFRSSGQRQLCGE